MKILYASSEALPFLASGGLADVAGALPRALCENGADCRVIMPLYSGIKPELRDKMTYLTSFSVPLGWRRQYCGIFTAEYAGVTYYFVDNEYYFKRDGLYGHYDDGERFAYFARAIVEAIAHIDFVPDVLHLNDWQTALAAVYINLFYRHDPRYTFIKTVFTIHNIQYQGKFGKEICEDLLGIDNSNMGLLEFEDCINFMKAAIASSNMVTTVSPSYANEIMDPWYSFGMDPFLRENSFKLCGILNGIDVDLYDPSKDPVLAKNYTQKAFLMGKKENKKAMCEELGLNYDENKPIVAIITRLVPPKGIDLIRYIFDDLMAKGVQVVLLGSGEHEYEEYFKECANRYPGDVSATIGFIPDLSRRIYAGADIFLMPSKSEPCGLSQMIACRYGTIPVVRETGGLRDSIIDFGTDDKNGCGYTFKTYNAHDMLGALERAIGAFHNKPVWKQQVSQAISADFSWKTSAARYMEMYNSL